MTPLVTAAIPAFNRARYLPRALDSVFAQTWRGPLEVIVVDDGSTDETPQALAPYSSRIRVVRQEHRGRSSARNTAVLEAQGRYLSFLDSDDRWLPDKLARQVPVLDDDPRVGMVHGHVDVVDVEGRVLRGQTERHHALFSAAHADGVTYAGYAFDCRCFSSAVTLRVEAVKSVGLYYTALLLDDYDLYLRLALEWRIAFLELPPVAEYRLHADQMSEEELTTGQIQTAEKHLRLLDDRRDLPDARLARRNFLLMLARSHAVLRDQRASRTALVRALRLDPGLLRRPWVSRRLVASILKS